MTGLGLGGQILYEMEEVWMGEEPMAVGAHDQISGEIAGQLYGSTQASRRVAADCLRRARSRVFKFAPGVAPIDWGRGAPATQQDASHAQKPRQRLQL
jgi:hypothetical protein